MINLQQQKAQIDYDAKKAKDELEAVAYAARQKFAEEEIIRVRWEAEELVKQIQRGARE